MGGMICYGPILREEKEPVFHAPWERQVFAMTMLAMGKVDTLDGFRHAVERMDPAHYLSSTYYEHWLTALETLAVEKGLLSPEELETGNAQTATGSTEPPLPPEAIPAVVNHGAPCDRPAGKRKPRFQPRDRVITRNLNPSGHTRLPRYVRGKQGVIHHIHGTFVYPDTNAHGQGEKPQPLYSVRFTARELWGPTTPRRDHLYIDLWEDYLALVPSPKPKKKTVKAATAKTSARAVVCQKPKKKLVTAKRAARKQRPKAKTKGQKRASSRS
jgi:nitrile hydratase